MQQERSRHRRKALLDSALATLEARYASPLAVDRMTSLTLWTCYVPDLDGASLVGTIGWVPGGWWMPYG